MKIHISHSNDAASGQDLDLSDISMPVTVLVTYDLIIGRAEGQYKVIKSRYGQNGQTFKNKRLLSKFVQEYIEQHA